MSTKLEMNFFGFSTLRTLPRYKPGTDLTIMHSMTFPATTQRYFVSISYMTVAEIIVDNCQAVYQILSTGDHLLTAKLHTIFEL